MDGELEIRRYARRERSADRKSSGDWRLSRCRKLRDTWRGKHPPPGIGSSELRHRSRRRVLPDARSSLAALPRVVLAVPPRDRVPPRRSAARYRDRERPIPPAPPTIGPPGVVAGPGTVVIKGPLRQEPPRLTN